MLERSLKLFYASKMHILRTARDFQDEAKKGGTPWFLAKSFDTSCPIAEFIDKHKLDPTNCELFCRINGVEKQKSKTNALIFDIPTLIAYITQYVTLHPGKRSNQSFWA